jgi:glycosyltransferase involved in cell wall biosynthesis
LPDFFSAEEIATRNRMQKRIFDAATIVLLSSFDAQNDLRMCAPEALGKSRVLHFVTGSGAEPGTRPKAALATAYGLDGPYFYLPNQFWIHKNHRIVIDALAILKARGRPALVAATGQTKDYRHPDFFKTLMEHAENAGVTDSFRVLGLVPYEDVPTLMQHCVASINPSLFEGWSTTVEESKAAGKKILLSDIGVHREQAPERGLFFDPDRPETLADLMDEALKSYSPTEDERYRAKAHAELPGRFTAFALNYQQIVVEAAGLNTRE